MLFRKITPIIRTLLRLMLCTSLIVFASLFINYAINLSPGNDGFCIGTSLARIIHGENFWSWEELRRGIQNSWSVSTIIMALNMLFEITNCIYTTLTKSKQ